MKIQADAIIFDKDGTLIDFDAFWISVSNTALTEFLMRLGCEDISVLEIMEVLGVKNGVVDINGILSQGTFAEMGEAAFHVFKRHGHNVSVEEITNELLSAFHKNMHVGDVRPTCDELLDVLTALRERGKHLFVVTTDNDKVTLNCLERLNVTEMFEKIYADDGKTPTKPDPFCAYDIAKRLNINKERIVMVGDTMTDVRFARNAGIKVLSLVQNKESENILAPHTDVVIHSLSELLDIVE